MIKETKYWKAAHLHPNAGHTRGGGGLQNEVPAVDSSSFDKCPTDHLRDLERNSKDLERNSRGLERNSRSLALGILTPDGPRALGISLIEILNIGFDIRALYNQQILEGGYRQIPTLGTPRVARIRK